MIKIVLLGAGNVGVNLFRALQKKKGIKVVQWFNRSTIPYDQEKIKVPTTSQLSEIVAADLYLISVSDSAITTTAKALENKKGLVAHTAGSVPLSILNQHQQQGVFYPLQTFSKQKEIHFNQIPLCLEANNDEDLALLRKVAESIGCPVHYINSRQRKALHVAAVFVNNFTNHLYAIGEELCREHHVPFTVLQPLIEETADKIKQLSPSAAQTGPAKRGDQNILEDHLKHLTKESHRQLYQLISSSIQQHG